MYVLTTTENHYFVEYLLKHLVISDSISEAMIFEENELTTAAALSTDVVRTL